MSYAAQILDLISDRIRELEVLTKEHEGTEHEYALKAGMYELLNLGVKVNVMVAQENKAIKARLQWDLEQSWKLSPDTSGGAFTQDEINRCRNGGW